MSKKTNIIITADCSKAIKEVKKLRKELDKCYRFSFWKAFKLLIIYKIKCIIKKGWND